MDGEQGFQAGPVHTELIKANGSEGTFLVGLGDHLLRRDELGEVGVDIPVVVDDVQPRLA